MSQPTRTASNGEDPHDRDAVEQPTAKADVIITRETVGNEVKVGRFTWRTVSETVVNSPNNRALAYAIGMIPAVAAGCLFMVAGHLLGADPTVSVIAGGVALIAMATIFYFVIRAKQTKTQHVKPEAPREQ